MSCAIHERIWEFKLEEERLIGRIHEAREERTTLEKALRIMESPYVGEFEGGTSAFIQDPEPFLSPYLRRGGLTLLYLDVARELAIANGGQIHVVDAAREIKDRGISKSKVPSLRATLHNAMMRSKVWVRMGEGTFQVLEGPV